MMYPLDVEVPDQFAPESFIFLSGGSSDGW